MRNDRISLFKRDNTSVSKKLSLFLISSPILFGISIFLGTKTIRWILLWISKNKLPKGGVTGFIIGAVIEGSYQLIPFLVISIIVRNLLKKDADMKEIYIKLTCMLLPISIITGYWLFVNIDPFVRSSLVFVNGILIFIGLQIGVTVWGNLKER